MSGPIPFEPRPEVAPGRLLMTLGAAGALAGLLIVIVFQWTQPSIQAYKAEQLRIAIRDVLAEPERFDTLYVVDGILTRELPAGTAPEDHEQIYEGFLGEESVGFAIASGEPGFQDVIRLIFGYDPGTGAVLGMKVLESKETPGLGDKIEKDSLFVHQFRGEVTVPLLGVKPRDNTGDPHEVDMITGATISSRAVIDIINNALERLEPLLTTYGRGGGR